MSERVNVADRLRAFAANAPERLAVVQAARRGYAACTFAELDADATALARGLVELGVTPGMRLVLLVRPGIEFVKLVFALLRSGATTVLVDPGMGRKHLVDCLAAADPDGFVAISAAQAVRVAFHRRFPRARLNVTVGRRWFWGGATYRGLLKPGRQGRAALPETGADDAAAIIFTSGSTGPPKGVLYTHRMFDSQAGEIQRQYGIQPGGVDLSCFALFGLFNSTWGVTTVFPQMDFSRPAAADSRKLLEAANDWKVTQAFASPAVWDKLSLYCGQTGERIPTLHEVFSCGAPVSPAVLERTLTMVHPEARMHTPYGATEALPISTIEAHDVLGETAAKTHEGAGVCVGRKFDSIQWRVVRITDEPIESIEDTNELPTGEIGELIVRGPQVSPAYVVGVRDLQPRALPGGKSAKPKTSPLQRDPRAEPGAEANRLSKIHDGDSVWHRMGDVGYLDEQGRFWYCGRKSQRVETATGPMFTAPVEELFNKLPGVRRSALVGLGRAGDQLPLVVVEPTNAAIVQSPGDSNGEPQLLIESWKSAEPRLLDLWQTPHGRQPLPVILFHPSLPVDVRHNAKINREQLASWAIKAIADVKFKPIAGNPYALSLLTPHHSMSPRSATGG